MLGRLYMVLQQYRKAYDAYQNAVNKEPANPSFWCSIGVLYAQLKQVFFFFLFPFSFFFIHIFIKIVS